MTDFRTWVIHVNVPKHDGTGGMELIAVKVSVDIVALANRYGQRARRNKNRKTDHCHGCVKVEYIA